MCLNRENIKNVPVINFLEHPGIGVRIEQIKNADISKHPFNELMEPHKHDYFTCLLVEEGSIDMLVDFQKITSSRNKLFISRPGQAHRLIKATPLTAYYLAIDNFLINDQVRDVLEQSLTEVLLINLTTREADWFKSLMDLMVKSADKINIQAMHALATSFMLQAASIYQQKESGVTSHYSANQINITKKFRQLVRYHYKALKRPGEYAEIMNLSVSYLNDTIRKVTGFSLSYFIQREIMLEAQRLLYDSGLSVKEIGLELGYEDYKYFSRVFNEVTGISPGEFRQKMLL